MGVETAIAGGLSMLGGAVQGNIDRDAKRRAAGQQRTALQMAQDTLNTGYNDQKGILQGGANKAQSYLDQGYNAGKDALNPWADAGKTALQGYQSLLSGATPLQASPQFTQASRLLKQQLASTGQSQSMSAVGEYSAPLISSEYTSQLNRFLPLLQTGYSASQGLTNLASSYGSQSATNQSNLATNTSNLRGGLANNIAKMQQTGGDINANQILSTAPQYGSMFGQAAQMFSGFNGFGSGGGGSQLNTSLSPQLSTNLGVGANNSNYGLNQIGF